MTKISREYTKDKTDYELIGNIGFGERVLIDKEKKIKVLITGAGSYIGNSFMTYANNEYCENFDIDSIDMIDGSWRSKDFSKYDAVYHVAGIAHADTGKVTNEVKEKYYQVNTDLAVEVAKKSKEEGVKCFIFMSSMIVYGDSAPYGHQKIISKDTVPKPSNFYGDSKLQADVGVRSLSNKNFKVIVLRPPMIYGKGSKGNYRVLSNIAKKLPFFPNIENSRSMLYIGNLCEFLCQIMLIKSIKNNEVVLIPQNSKYVRTSTMVKEIRKTYGKKMFIVGGISKPIIYLFSKIPGKFGALTNKAFGNYNYDYSVSEYPGIDYQQTTFETSIYKTET